MKMATAGEDKSPSRSSPSPKKSANLGDLVEKVAEEAALSSSVENNNNR